ncbi:hypothetical protein E2C01_038769 [Portunus trituberculatus]|uniref:Uncharacterized protein n=1 Tax=Portunus trituberculatus TaxID=210409 RepID=A0A5B7FHN2_PORTR|nr:hypothetical protein [Portunus trituberculatus]
MLSGGEPVSRFTMAEWWNRFRNREGHETIPKTDPCHWRRHRRHIKGEGEGKIKGEEVEEEEDDGEKEGKESKVDHNASTPANMSESLRMTLEVVRDEQVFHARRKSRGEILMQMSHRHYLLGHVTDGEDKFQGFGTWKLISIYDCNLVLKPVDLT